MHTFFRPATVRRTRFAAGAGLITLFLALGLSGCGGSGGGLFEEPGLVLSQDSVGCSADPGVSCEASLTAQPPEGASTASISWTERPAAGGLPVVSDVRRTAQSDGTWHVVVFFKRDPPAGNHAGSIELNLMDLFSQRPPATLSYSLSMDGAQGTLSPLKPLPGGRDWETFGGDAAHRGAVR